MTGLVVAVHFLEHDYFYSHEYVKMIFFYTYQCKMGHTFAWCFSIGECKQHNSGLKENWVVIFASSLPYVLPLCEKSLGYVSLCSKAVLDIPMHLLLASANITVYLQAQLLLLC